MADSLIQQIQQLGIPQQAQIMQELNNKYPESLELTTAYTQLIEWIQNQTWVHLQLDRNNEEHCKQAKILMGEISAQLQPDSMNFHGVVTARALLSKYEADPISLVMAFQEINLFMITLVQRFIMTKNAGENAAMQEDVDDTMEEEVEDNVLEEINKDLSEATEESRKNERFLKQVEHSKEQYIILYQEKHSEATQLENQKKTLVGSSKQAEKIKLLEKKLSEIQQELNVKGNELTVTKRLAVYNILSEHHKKLTEIQKSIIAEINDWTNCQQKALSGWPKPQQLNDLQPLCEVHTELLCRLYQHIIKLDGMFRPALAQDKGELERIDNLKLNARNLLSHFLNKCFVIEKHPQQVLKTNTKFGVSLRHLIGGKLNAHIYPPDVTCTIVSEKYVRSLYQTKGKINPPPQDKNILNNKKTMEYNQKTNTFAVEFKNLSITRANRQGGKKEESVCEEKRCLQFVSEINIGREKYTVMTLSFPTVITVHGNQFPDAEATIIWDNAFAEPNRLPFDVPEKVSWPELAEALNKRWTFANERELSEPNMMYIAGKLFPGVSKDDLETCEVSRADFSREHLNGRPFTFWKWFFSILDVVKRNMLDEWRNGIIYGFMSKQDAQDELIKYQPGCFLVRFSDSELGGVTIAYTVPAGEVWNLSPWTNNNFAMRRFSDRIKDLEALTHLYPNEQGKHDAFGRYYSEDEKDVPQDPGEYRETVLATKVKGESGINTPMASPLHSGGHMDFMTNMAVRSITSSPPSICADSFDIANEEIVTSDGADAIEMLSNVSALIAETGCHESFSAIAAGIAQQPFTPISITEDQWPLSFN